MCELLSAFRAVLLQRSAVCLAFRLRSLPRGLLCVQPLSGRLKARLLPAHRKTHLTRIPASCAEVVFIGAILRCALTCHRLRFYCINDCSLPGVRTQGIVRRIVVCRFMIRHIVIRSAGLRCCRMITKINYCAGPVSRRFCRDRSFLFFFPRIFLLQRFRRLILRRISFLHFVHRIRLISAVVCVRSRVGIRIRSSITGVCTGVRIRVQAVVCIRVRICIPAAFRIRVRTCFIRARILFQRLQIIKAVSGRGCRARPLASRQPVRNRHSRRGTSCRADRPIRIFLDVFEKAMSCGLVKISHNRTGIFKNPLRPFLIIGASDPPAYLIPFLHDLADGALAAVRLLFRLFAALPVHGFRGAALTALFPALRSLCPRFFAVKSLLRCIICGAVVSLLRRSICVSFRLRRRLLQRLLRRPVPAAVDVPHTFRYILLQMVLRIRRGFRNTPLNFIQKIRSLVRVFARKLRSDIEALLHGVLVSAGLMIQKRELVSPALGMFLLPEFFENRDLFVHADR